VIGPEEILSSDDRDHLKALQDRGIQLLVEEQPPVWLVDDAKTAAREQLT